MLLLLCWPGRQHQGRIFQHGRPVLHLLLCKRKGSVVVSFSCFCKWFCGTMGVYTKPCEPLSSGVEDLYPLGAGLEAHCLGGLGGQQLTARMVKPFLLLVCFALRLSLVTDCSQGSPGTSDPPSSTCSVLGLRACTTMSGLFVANGGTQGFTHLGMHCMC